MFGNFNISKCNNIERNHHTLNFIKHVTHTKLELDKC